MNALVAKVEANTTKGALQVVAFPSDVFGKQEPGANSELLNGLRYVRPGNGFVPSFPLTEKCDVNGAQEHPLFTFLKSTCPTPVPFRGDTDSLFWTPIKASDITWNFEKFLIDSEGKPRRRYTPNVDPVSMYGDVMALLTHKR